MVIQKKIIYYIVLIFTVLSCRKEVKPEDDIIPKPSGQYLSEISTNIYPFTSDDSLKLASFEYDNYRYLKKIKFYIPENQQYKGYIEFFYDSIGRVDYIHTHYGGSYIYIREKFIYENNELAFINEFTIDAGPAIKTLVKKTAFTANPESNVVEVRTFELKEDTLVERPDYEKNHYDSNGNLYKVHYNSGTGNFNEKIDEYAFDNMKSPFTNLRNANFSIVFPHMYSAQWLSMNNVVKHKDYVLGKQTTSYDTIVYKYKDNYPIELANYTGANNSPLKLKSRYFFKYIVLK
ncbi:MAG TPA: hypothetical protein VFG54_07340 [Prolixibacteraceae bacterium]|nr:hypothetical protein [Prolixibacteraceae bacterium]